MSDLVAFLRARLDGDEAWGRSPECPMQEDPARVLREVEAKRRIVSLERDWPYGSGDPEGAEYGWSDVMDRVLRLLALPYSDHSDYREEWRPQA